MSILRFKPEIWAAELLVALRKSLVYGSDMVVNHDYEGEIAESGDTVRITSISRPTISTYIPGTTVITPEQLTDAQRTLVVDQCKYFAFAVDDVDQRQAAGDVVGPAMSEAGYAMADVVDQYLASLYTQVQSANQLGTISVTTASPTDFYDKVLVPLWVSLSEANVPDDGRYVILPPWCYGRLLRDDRFVRWDASGNNPTAAATGFVGNTLVGFSVMVSNNAPLVTGDDFAVTAGRRSAISMAMQINKTEAYRPQSSFSDAVKGLTLYGAKVIRPDSIASAIVSKT